MREPPVAAFTQRREDVVVSACFSDIPATPRTFTVLRKLAATLDTRYRFREIILVVEDSARLSKRSRMCACSWCARALNTTSAA